MALVHKEINEQYREPRKTKAFGKLIIYEI